MARTKVNREQALKDFVTVLQKKYPNKKMYTRVEVKEAAQGNPVGLATFRSTSANGGYGSLTRMTRGNYVIPADWLTGKAPWDLKASAASGNE